MTQPLLGFLAFAVGTVVVLTVPVLAVWLAVHLVKGLGFALGGAAKGIGYGVRHVARFVKGTVVDTLQFGGSVMTACVVLPLAVANAGIGRFRAARHYGRALEDELTGALVALYRVGIGHPVHFLGLGALTDGLERRLPDLLEREPRTGPALRRASRTASASADEPAFEGYAIQKELQAGGSGARLFLAIPTTEHAERLARRGVDVPGRVVIKAFDRSFGSTIPQIVRESRSLEAARRLGLILEHAIDDEAFHYVMPFVPGEDLDAMTRKMHARSTGDGLDARSMNAVLGYARDLCDHLARFHDEGLWHKDIKPSNLLVSEGRLHVVDFGLVTPLESALTLTTHGTEFFRDPELVRLALAGRRVMDVDGVKFDLYSAGAVLYSMIENSFPAHGSLSSISKPVPEALRWIVRRSMADVEKRYASAEDMARDIDVLLAARNPYDVRPADLPSVRGDSTVPPFRPRANQASFTRESAKAAFAGAAAGFAPDLGASRQERPHRDADDVRRFSAFGMTAEVHGLGRVKSSLHSVRSDRKRKCAERQASRERATTAAREARDEARSNRRSRRRGMLRAMLILAIFVGIAGGAGTFLHDKNVELSWAHASQGTHRSFEVALDAPAPLAPASTTDNEWQPESDWRFASSTENALSALGPAARILVLTDPFDLKSSHDARQAALRLRALGARPIGVTASGRNRLPRHEIELLGEARYEIEQSRGSALRAMQRLESFAQDEPLVDAVLWLDRQERSGNLRTQLALDDYSTVRIESKGWGTEEAERKQVSKRTTTSGQDWH